MRKINGSPHVLAACGLLLAAGCAGNPEDPSGLSTGVSAVTEGVVETGTFETLYGRQVLTYLRVGDDRIFEGDILLPPSIEERAAVTNPLLRSFGRPRAIQRWPNNTIPYRLPLTLAARASTLAAMAHWAQNTSIRFRERTTETDFLDFVSAPRGCVAPAGDLGGAQAVNVSGDCDVGEMIHTLGHSVGFFHEENRPDREAFVSFDFDCVSSLASFNFLALNPGSSFGLYDFRSVMHSDSRAHVPFGAAPASCENGQFVLWRRASAPWSFAPVVAQREGLSFIDRQAVEEMYSESVGASVVIADFNHDGFSDLAVGAPRRGVEDGGRVRIYRGAAGGLGSVGELAQPAPEEGDRFGQALATGDFNDDGVADLAVGAPGEDSAAGRVSVFFGSPQSASLLVHGVELTQGGLSNDEPGERFGHALAAGDFDGDGREDLAVGTPGQRVGADAPSAGAVMLFRGTSAGIVRWKMLTAAGLDTDEAGNNFGASLASADFNLDGRTDLVVGAPHMRQGWSAPGNGAALLFRGGTLEGWRILRPAIAGSGLYEPDLTFGFAMTTGDFNGDNIPDLAVSAPAATVDSGRGAGRVFTYQSVGANGPSVVTEALASPAATQGAAFGFSLAAGRSRYASRDDLAVGAPGGSALGTNSGLVYVYSPSPAGLGAPRALTQDILDIDEAGDRYGAAVAFGDFDGNGFADLVAGAPGEVWIDPTGQRGRAFVWRSNGLILSAFAGVGP